MAETPFSSNNIFAGSVHLYVAPVGTVVPTLPALAGDPLTVAAAWTPVGYTDAGITFAYAPTNKDINVDEEMSPVRVLKTAESLKISASLAEATIENMNRALSGANITTVTAGTGIPGSATLDIGGSQLYTEFALLIVGSGPAPSFFPRLSVVWRSMATANVSMSFKKDDKTVVPVEFTALADSTRPQGQRLFRVYEKRANATG